ncbi:hypothetical protein NDU88_001630 [Pleurodeles waltl]|uniref:Uncharacterized protein n=1 Tax=Pleurodeles waltl TaxID=8319 RepID=A0AAV7P7A9_PLEWA|nr:hypothetical protein NDU88_001630 [Pleurodeles waltl]
MSCDLRDPQQDRSDVAESPVTAIGGKSTHDPPDGCDKTPRAAAAMVRSWWQKKEPVSAASRSEVGATFPSAVSFRLWAQLSPPLLAPNAPLPPSSAYRCQIRAPGPEKPENSVTKPRLCLRTSQPHAITWAEAYPAPSSQLPGLGALDFRQRTVETPWQRIQYITVRTQKNSETVWQIVWQTGKTGKLVASQGTPITQSTWL